MLASNIFEKNPFACFYILAIIVFALLITGYVSSENVEDYGSRYDKTHYACNPFANATFANQKQGNDRHAKEKCEYNDKKEKASNDWQITHATNSLAADTFWLFFATVLLGGFTFWLVILAIRQSNDARNAAAAAKRAADAAEASANSYKTTERPYLRVEDIIIRDDLGNVPHDIHPQIEYKIHNFGRTPAFLRRIHTRIVTFNPGGTTQPVQNRT